MFIEMCLLCLLSPVRAACVETATNAMNTPKLTPMQCHSIVSITLVGAVCNPNSYALIPDNALRKPKTEWLCVCRDSR